MAMRAVCIVVCLCVGVPDVMGDAALITKFNDIGSDWYCEHFLKPEMNESSWNKNSAKSEYTSGNTAASQFHIAQIHLDLGKFNNQHITRLCTIDCRKTAYQITGYTIKSVGPHAGDAIIFTNNNEQLTFSGQAHEKSQGFQFDVNVWGTKNGNIALNPFAGCISPRHIAGDLDRYCTPPSPGCSGKGCGKK